MDWLAIRDLMLSEPKPPLSCVVVERGPERTRTARVLHDGDARWFVWSSEKIELNDGERAVIFREGTMEEHPSAELYSHGWIKSIFHPRLTNIAEPTANGRVVGSAAPDGLLCWQVDLGGLRHDEDVTFSAHVHVDSGIIVALTGSEGNLAVSELRLGIDIAPELFRWSSSTP